MVTTPTSLPSVRSHLRPARFILYFFVIIFFLLACGVAGFYFVAHTALPQLDGRIAAPGLSAAVTVIRDAHGAPTIDATNFDDLFFAQGYVTAQDRLFQMDGMRRLAAGELAEVFGSDYVEHDRQQRILGLKLVARRTIEGASAENRSHFLAYARGVNAYIESHRDRLPLEFRILRYSPKPWTPEDSALIGAFMVEDLSTSPRHALAREKILAKLGPELTADLFVNSSWHDRPPTVSRPRLDEEIHGNNPNHNDQNDNDEEDDEPDTDTSVTYLAPGGGAPALPGMWFDEPPLVLGSNNWVVSGEHTVSGKPLLSNDMHLGHQMPNLWYEAHLRCKPCGIPGGPGFDVAGVTLPGHPYVIVGHNQRIGWGFTNLGPTVEDVYVETFNSDGLYLTPDGWKQPEQRREVIKVKNKADVTVDVLLTRHGPIITDMVPGGETRKLSLRWTLYDGIRNPFYAVDSARTWEEFRQAFSALDAPGQNVVYADVDGNIGYQATGKVPIRAAGDGSLPENGSDNTHEWIGYVPFEKMPSVFNPPSGIVATANSRITPDGYKYSLSSEWEAPWRTARIYRVLESGKKFSAADMLALETDVYSELDRFFAERFVYAVDHAQNPSARTKAAAEILRQWDGRMAENSAAPTIAVRAREELTRLLLEPKLGPAPKDPQQLSTVLSWKTYRWMMSSVWLENVVQHQPKRWLPESYANYDQLLSAAVAAAVESSPEAHSSVPSDLNTWLWGDFHPLEIRHPVFGKIPLLRRWTGPGLHPQSGSEFTVKAVSRSHGPSERMTVDLSDLDQSTINLVTGEGGNLLSPYYLDQWNAWYQGFSFLWPFSDAAVTKAAVHKLELEPAR